MLVADAIDWIRVPLAVAFMLVLVVGVHEGGHFVVGKLSGIRVDEFALGFGPRILSKRRGETLYSIRAIPAGGFVRLAGMTGLETGDDDAGPRNFIRASIPRRALTILAGGLINLLFAGLLFGIIRVPSVPSSIAADSAASQAGLRDGDTIVAVAGRTVDTTDPGQQAREIRTAVGSNSGGPVPVTYTDPSGAVHRAVLTPMLVVTDLGCAPNGRDGSLPGPQGLKRITAVDGVPVSQGSASVQRLLSGAPAHVTGYLFGDQTQQFSNAAISGVHLDLSGTAPAEGTLTAAWLMGYSAGVAGTSLPVALVQGVASVPGQIASTATGIWSAATTPNAGGLTGCAGLSGPVGIVAATASATRSGVWGYVGLIALVSLSLGIMNLLPIPFLDGGKLLFVIIEAVRRRRIDPRKEAMVHAAGLAFLVMFVIYITVFGDIRRLFE